MNGWIGFEHAALMVLGENLGTTLSAITASTKASGTAKRAALAHFFFNLFGVVWALLFFKQFISLNGWVIELAGGKNPLTSLNSVPIALALFHTLFNLLNMLILLPFSNIIKQLVTRAVPTVSIGESDFKFSYIKIGLLSTTEASLYQAKMETMVFAERVRKMFRSLEKLLSIKDDKEYQDLKAKIIDEESYADRLEHEIANYLTKVAESRLSESNSRRLRTLFNMIDDLESIADSCINILNAFERQRSKKVVFPEPIKNNISLMFNMVNDALDTMVTMMTHSEELPLSLSQNIEEEINNFRDILKNEHISNLTKGIYQYDEGIIYNDIISQCERIGDFTINVVEDFKNQF
jgi:phosphate:Na+ symporter